MRGSEDARMRGYRNADLFPAPASSKYHSGMLCLPILAAVVLQTAEPFLRYPDIHGNEVVFTSEGDLWLGDLKSGSAHRITSDPGIERNAAFSPDGTMIAFEGEYDGQRQAYVMAAAGGPP